MRLFHRTPTPTLTLQAPALPDILLTITDGHWTATVNTNNQA